MGDLVDFSDFLPTFIDLAGAQLTSDRTIDGTSFADGLRGQGASPRTWAYSESAVLPKPGGVEPDGEHSGLRWVRNARWKLYSDDRLYDMQLDDGERAAIPKAADTPGQSTARSTLIRALKSLSVQ